MTNEEAISYLEGQRACICSEDCQNNYDYTYCEQGFLCNDVEAINMAIEALKEQPKSCEYAVSAIAVEEMLRDLLPVLGMLEIEGDEAKTAAVCETVHNALDGLWKLPFVKPDSKESSLTQKALDSISRVDAIDAIKTSRYLVDAMEKIIRLPSAQPEQRWIPCSERLPENDERVLATTAWGDVTIAERIYPPINDTCWFIHDGNTNATIDDVVAWMSLPEPYRGEKK